MANAGFHDGHENRRSLLSQQIKFLQSAILHYAMNCHPS